MAAASLQQALPPTVGHRKVRERPAIAARPLPLLRLSRGEDWSGTAPIDTVVGCLLCCTCMQIVQPPKDAQAMLVVLFLGHSARALPDRICTYSGTSTSASGRSAENLGRWPGEFVSRCCKNRATPEATCSTLSHRCSSIQCLRLVLLARSICVCTRVADDIVPAIPMNLSLPLDAQALPLGSRVSADRVLYHGLHVNGGDDRKRLSEAW